ncbi:MAG: flagellar hook-basal body complex protein FliE [Sphingopyxis sp.]|nr:flagellar hook-basal body complex protein FliE [Sphingopyxis sp.]
MSIEINRVLALRSAIVEQNDALRRAAGTIPGGVTAGDGTSGPFAASQSPGGFAAAMQSALGQVNSLQADASSASEAYERGETTDIAAVMLARQQASLGFEATMQVRNKLLSAYRDIMSMPV